MCFVCRCGQAWSHGGDSEDGDWRGERILIRVLEYVHCYKDMLTYMTGLQSVIYFFISFLYQNSTWALHSKKQVVHV